MNLLTKERVLLELDIKNKDELFAQVAKMALATNIVQDSQELVVAFNNREAEVSTAFENGFAIPHAHSPIILEPAVFFVRFQEPIIWDGVNQVSQAILLLIPDRTNETNKSTDQTDIHLDTLSGIAIKLLDKEICEKLKFSHDVDEIVTLINQPADLSHQTDNQSQSENSLSRLTKVVGITSCATGVAHTYMAREALLKAAEELNWDLHIEAQGQKGPEFILTDEQIQAADMVILATDIGVETDRFIGKKIYRVGTKAVVNKPLEELQKGLAQAKIEQNLGEAKNLDNFVVKDKQKWVSHIMNGISYMIPFIVFAGLISAIVSGIGSAAKIDLNGDNFLATLNQFAGIGFTVMMGVAGGYIANSVAGRSAIAPAFILTMAGNNPKLVWQGYFKNVMVDNPITGNFESINALMQPLNIVGAIIFGLAVGYTVKWINTKWKINKYIQPIMPIIIIPVFLTLIFWLAWMFTFGPLIGVALGYFNFAIMKMEASGVGMVFVGLVLGLLAGVDMGGPINKISSFGATALIPIDNGIAMGCAAAAFGVAPLGCGITSLLFRKKLNEDKGMAINTTILGFMGISEGAIPFATKHTWAVIIPNIVGSGVAGMLAGLFKLRGHVGAWGGPIIAIFGGVDTTSGSYVGIPLFLLAIAAGTFVHIILFRLLFSLKNGEKIEFGKLKLTKNQTKTKIANQTKQSEIVHN
ncbi:PTS system fructose-specific IIC component [Entomoplasma freundtii]|uniref:PTS system, fructose-specific IIA component n=1 Tax=Entomoplasma freundtii TaxID=74700 RepID=A0A2K8NR61_9MOLU|nr:fructose PTS transporter subunit IIB [Entomoplasma freundtii]ATZ16277.1 PTS system, fructose-specific IIA component [Entomoplasma freundtii]TDY56822.1 PTS system fructose-specific IIC component [Entomoplasma freundtii]